MLSFLIYFPSNINFFLWQFNEFLLFSFICILIILLLIMAFSFLCSFLLFLLFLRLFATLNSMEHILFTCLLLIMHLFFSWYWFCLLFLVQRWLGREFLRRFCFLLLLCFLCFLFFFILELYEPNRGDDYSYKKDEAEECDRILGMDMLEEVD